MAGSRTSPSGRQQKGQPKAHEGDTHTSQQVTAPVRASKRRHQATTSPVTARSESRSPRAKQRPVIIRQSPPTISAAPAVAAVTTTIPATSSPPNGRTRTESRSGSVSPSQLAVPRVSAEPPCPSMLPMPPVHWRAGEDAKCPAQRQHCRAVTESLLNHLTTSGILVTA
ncbi:uncharacterized protein LOC125037597 [Penaeus chinensis]|uniref:uncharacterized protein LOC125037597 n=1 Tax=Penaeus chinensis TaxID=139456 RepID=UPI001FB81AF9|nr:uncharacterized protein LOC125037597 [Penaeus chinensis]